MKLSSTARFPQSVQLFRFCYRMLSQEKGAKVRDQTIGNMLGFNPSDCSHWKRGEKSVRSVFALEKIAETLNVEPMLVQDIASGAVDLDEAIFECGEAKQYRLAAASSYQTPEADVVRSRRVAADFAQQLHQQINFQTAPLYLPEIMRSFSFISAQATDMTDKLSRILRTKPGHYAIHYRKGEMHPQTRLSMVRDLARILFEAERQRFPELGPLNKNLAIYEQLEFVGELFMPQSMFVNEFMRIDNRRNLVAELAATFWVPKSLVGQRLQEVLRRSV